MHGIGHVAARAKSSILAMLALAIAGCATYLPDAPPVADEPVVVAVPDPVVAPQPQPQPQPERAANVPTPPREPPIAIVLTNNQPAYLDVAVELASYFSDHKLYDLSNESLPPVAVLRSINDTNVTVVVAIGLRAAQSSIAMAQVPVVFSQVFNHQDNGLLTANSRGVAAVAPLEAQLAAWKRVNPTVSRIGLIIGEGHDALLADAEVAAARHDIQLEVRIAHSDQETLYLFRRMIRDIEGFWLLPDNRVLSARVLHQMVEEANRHQVPFVVPNEAMLQMGAAMSLSTVAADIAATIARVVRRIQAGELEKLPPISPLSEVRVAINDKVPARQAVAKASGTQ